MRSSTFPSSYLLIAIAGAAAAAVGATTARAAEESGIGVKVVTLRDARTQLRLGDCTLNSATFDDCDLLNYAIRLALQGGFPIVLFVVMLLLFPFYCSFRWCCNCCGGRRQTYGYCCPTSKEKHDEQVHAKEVEAAAKRRNTSLLQPSERRVSIAASPNRAVAGTGSFANSPKRRRASSRHASAALLQQQEEEEEINRRVAEAEAEEERKDEERRASRPFAIEGAEGAYSDEEGGEKGEGAYEMQRVIAEAPSPSSAAPAGGYAVAPYPNATTEYPPQQQPPPLYSHDGAPSGVETVAVRYTFFDILRPKLLTLVVLCIASAGLALGLVGSFKIMDSIDTAFVAITGIPDTVMVQVDLIVSQMAFESYSASTDTTSTTNFMLTTQEGMDAYAEITSAADEMKAMIADATGDLRDQIKSFDFVPILVFTIPCLFPVLGVIFAIFNVRTFFPQFNMALMTFFGALMWLLHVVFSVAAIAVNDLSNELHAVTNGKMNVLVAVSGCTDSTFISVKSSFFDMARVEARNLCADLPCYDTTKTSLQNVQDGNVIDCTPLAGRCPTITAVDFFSALEFDVSLHSAIKQLPDYVAHGYWCAADGPTCSLSECLDTCRDSMTDPTANPAPLSTLGKTSKEIVYSLRGVRKVLKVFDEHAVMLSACQPIISLALLPARDSLDSLRSGLFDIRSASAIFGIAFIAGLFAMAWGTKRFISFSFAGKEIIYDAPESIIETGVGSPSGAVDGQPLLLAQSQSPSSPTAMPAYAAGGGPLYSPQQPQLEAQPQQPYYGYAPEQQQQQQQQAYSYSPQPQQPMQFVNNSFAQTPERGATNTYGYSPNAFGSTPPQPMGPPPHAIGGGGADETDADAIYSPQNANEGDPNAIADQ